MTPEQLAEATRQAVAMQQWQPSLARFECRCSGRCLHGETCRDCRLGKLAHLAREPEGPFNEFLWQEHHRCENTHCDSGVWFYTSEYPDRPWGYRPHGTSLELLPGVRYPGFARLLARRLEQQRQIEAGTYDWGDDFYSDAYTL